MDTYRVTYVYRPTGEKMTSTREAETAELAAVDCAAGLTRDHDITGAEPLCDACNGPGSMSLQAWTEGATAAQLAQARDWVADCQWVESAEELAELSDAAIVRGVDRHYEGGWPQFVADIRPQPSERHMQVCHWDGSACHHFDN